MSTLSERSHQMFPKLDAAQLETALRFASGPERRFARRVLAGSVGHQHRICHR
jgi:thioredoxin reductase (NADPH)